MSRINLHKNESGQTALEAAIILIAFVVVASIFAFTVLSAGASTTEKGEEAVYAGLEGVQSSMSVRGAVIATEDTVTAGQVGTLVFTVSPVAGGDPLDVNAIVIGYRDNTQQINSITPTIAWVRDVDGGTPDDLLEEGELAEVTLDISAAALGPNTEFTIELKPPTGAVFSMNRSTPAAIEAVMELR